MFSRTRIAIGLALMMALITSITAFAKGGFDFIAISGSNLKETVHSTDPTLTMDFFAFADFYRKKADAPTNPGTSFEVTRFYIDNSREIAFDRLHYYPETGFVFYDGIVNGSSAYDGKWYTAQPEIKSAFEKALFIPSGAAAAKPVEVQEVASAELTQSRLSIVPLQPILLTAIMAVLVLVFAFAFRRRDASTQ